MSYFPRISGPVALYSNLPIKPEYYKPSQFEITDITYGSTTTVTMEDGLNDVAPNYVVGQWIRFNIPSQYGSFQLNGKLGMVLSIPSASSVEVDINSVGMDAFVANPFVSNISAVTSGSTTVLTVNKTFRAGFSVTIAGVNGMTELNGNTYEILSNTSSTITLDVDSTGFSAYTSGGTATLTTKPGTLPQILAVGDQCSGQINSSGRVSQETFIPGSFQDISP